MSHKRMFIVIVTFGIIILCGYSIFVKNDCYKSVMFGFNRPTLKNILDINVKEGSIFFIETSLNNYEQEVPTLNRRASCAVESAALHHPNRSIYLIYMFPNETQSMHIEDKYLKAILNYENVNIVYAKFSDYVKNTKVEDLFKKDLIENSKFSIAHFSDIFRLITLLNFGGIYMDTDVIVLKPMDDLGGNFVGKESQGIMANGVMGFDKKGVGLINNILSDINEHYNPNIWAAHGPLVVTKWIKDLCKTNKTIIEKEKCDFLKILPTNYFYPIHWSSWKKLFDGNYTTEVLKTSQTSYLVHVWNKITSNVKLNIHSSNASILVFAKNHCPRTFKKLNKYY